MTLSDVVSGILLFTGAFFTLVAAVGFMRLPDVFSRLHVTAILDTLGAPIILLGAAVHVGLGLTAVKLVLAIAFLFVTSPLVGHLLSRAALESGHQPWTPGGGNAGTDPRDGSPRPEAAPP